jgi:hypothetical protein
MRKILVIVTLICCTSIAEARLLRRFRVFRPLRPLAPATRVVSARVVSGSGGQGLCGRGACNVPVAVRAAPAAAPAAAPVTEQAVAENFGVDLDKLRPGGDAYRLGDRECSREEAIRAIEKGLPDDAGKLRITLIGPDAFRKPIEREVRTSELASRCLLWSVPPDHWSLRDLDAKKPAFKVDGSPTIYCQAPDGRVLWRQDDGARALENLRKVAKSYDAKKDPGPGSGGGIDWSKIPAEGWIVGAVLAFLALSSFLKGKP